MATVNCALNIEVVTGPKIAVSKTVTVEAYDKIEVVINAGGAAAPEISVDIQPSSTGKVNLVFIKSSLYSDNITYKVSDGTTDSDPIILDQYQIYSGKGALSLLAASPITAPKILKFKNVNAVTNPATNDATIEILVGRNAV
jgi:hypothetical protein